MKIPIKHGRNLISLLLIILIALFSAACSSVKKEAQKNENIDNVIRLDFGRNTSTDDLDKTDNDNTTPENSIEEYIYKAFKGANTSENDRIVIMNTIQYIDWWKYYQFSHGKGIELIDWLYTIKITDPKEMTSVLKATKNLDGAVAEGYSDIIANIFLENKLTFIQCLSQFSYDEIDNICCLLAYGCSYGKNYDEIKSETDAMISKGILSIKEKKVVDAILFYLNNGLVR